MLFALLVKVLNLFLFDSQKTKAWGDFTNQRAEPKSRLLSSALTFLRGKEMIVSTNHTVRQLHPKLGTRPFSCFEESIEYENQ